MSHALSLPFGHGTPPARGVLRAEPEDFQVDEDIGFEPGGAGEHVLLRIRKRGANTEWVARRIAQVAQVRAAAVSFAGMKDRNAVTSQWFSVHLPGREDPDWSALNDSEIALLDATRHHRKLRRGALRGNRFELVIRQVRGDPAEIEARLRRISVAGVPGYFGAQRFGRDGGNVERARAMFDGMRVSRHERSVLLSAARSWLFNKVLAERVRRGQWDQLLDGDVAMLDGSHSVFSAASVDAVLADRCERLDIHPTGPLWGRGELASTGQTLILEQSVLADDEAIRGGLERAGLQQQRRALRHAVRDLQWQWQAQSDLRVEFFLDRGNYATSAMRELLGDGPDLDYGTIDV